VSFRESPSYFGNALVRVQSLTLFASINSTFRWQLSVRCITKQAKVDSSTRRNSLTLFECDFPCQQWTRETYAAGPRSLHPRQSTSKPQSLANHHHASIPSMILDTFPRDNSPLPPTAAGTRREHESVVLRGRCGQSRYQ